MGFAMSKDTDSFAAFDETPTSHQKLIHPIEAVCHVLFRASAIIVYCLCTWVSSSFIGSFLVVVGLLCVDFWTVKNVTGRRLAGLRWWNLVSEDGKSEWHFESRVDNTTHHPREIRLFWVALWLAPIIWAIFILVALLTLKIAWITLPIIAFTMSAANLWGYLRCRWSSRQEISNYLSSKSFTWFQSTVHPEKKAAAMQEI